MSSPHVLFTGATISPSDLAEIRPLLEGDPQDSHNCSAD
jgi:hypothetical protein